MIACSLELFGVVSASKAAIQVRTNGSVRSGFKVVACQACQDPACVEACERGALVKNPEGGPSLVKPEECEGCEEKTCAEACSIGALRLDPETGRPIICTQCGVCAKFCPHDVLFYGEVGV